MAAPVSPSRRVLADKSTNASVQYHGHDNNNKVTEMKPWVCTDMRNVPVTFDTEAEPKIGQKRSIVHVDGAEEREQDGLKKEVCEPVKEVKEKTEVKLKEDEDDAAISEGECRSVSKEEGDDAETEQKSEDSNATTGTKEEGDEAGTANNLLSSFHASQEGPLPHEEQFEIQDEVSQNTLETLNKTQLPQNSSQPKTSTVSSSPMEGSQESIKMSSFINYDQTLVEEEWPARMIRQRDAQLDAEARQKMIDERAEELTLRLKLATYKVVTDQTNTPFRWLPQPSAPIWGLLAGIAVNEDDDEYSDDEFSDDEYDKEYEDKDEEDFKDEELKDEVAKDECVKGRNIKGEEFKNEGFKVEAVKAEEHRCGAKSPSVEEKPTVPNLTSLPTPTILPTAYSARYILTAKEEVESALPPTSREQVETPRVLHTELPEPEKNMHPRTPLQLKSSSGSEECRYADKHGSQIPHEERDVTSSAAKDEAANGLLELNRAATET